MRIRPSDVTVTDLFCGAGGSTTGSVQAGASVKLAVNHWPRAIETHNTNYPSVDHVLTDISQADPRRYPATTVLIGSPECVNHSLAKGKKRKHLGQATLWEQAKPIDPAEERSRCTMWDPLRFAEQHDYQLVILENVVDARNWRMWDAWLHGWQTLDYSFELVYFNSQFAHPTPQSRDRLYFVAWKRKNRKPDLIFTPLAFCQQCGKDQQAVQSWKKPTRRYGKYGRSGQYLYRCPSCTNVVTPYYYGALNAIDWTIPTQRIKERAKPLKDKTLRRIERGLRQFQEEAFTVQVNKTTDLLRPVSSVLPTQTAENGLALVTPFLLNLSHGSDSGRVFPVRERPFPTQTARDDVVLVTPFIVEQLWEYRLRAVTDPLSTVVAEGNHHGLVLPPTYLMSYYRNGKLQSITEPTGTVTTLERHAIVTATPSSDVGECGFRMLEPPEIQAAMAFPREYVVTGTRREQVRQLGNACTPPVIKMLMERALASLAG